MMKEDLLSFLKDCQICRICELRYTNAEDNDYLKVVEEMQQLDLKCDIGQSSFPSKKQRLPTCPTCLGVFSEDFQSELIHRICETSNIQEYDCEKIVIALSMPINIQIRQLSMWFALLEKFGASNVSLERMPDAPIKEIIKLIINAKICKELRKSYDTDGVIINIALDYNDNCQELKQLKQLHAKMYPQTFGRKASAGAPNKVSRGVMEKYYTPRSLKAQLFQEYLPIPPIVPNHNLTINTIDIIGPTTFVAGRYRKLSRKLSHTPWVLNGKRIMEESIEEIIIQCIAPYFRCSNSRVIFMSSGREDVDVRCLGRGRPFILEILNARKTILPMTEARKMELAIESSHKLSVVNLQVVNKDETLHIKTGEEQKRKFYRALCLLENCATREVLEKLNLPNGFEVQQTTPLRVLHRRPLLTRQRMIYNLKTRVCRTNTRLLILDITAQAGTYIKELVHGEFGRTRPSISELIDQPIDIMALDVMAIYLDWPKDIDNRLTDDSNATCIKN